MHTWLTGLGIDVGCMPASWGVLVLLAHTLPPGILRDLAAFIPDCLTTVRRLAREARGGPHRRSDTAVTRLITMGDNPERLHSEASFAALHSEASFAALCGVSPVERSSGSRQYRRLNRGGDRQANAALHRIVQSRLRFDPRTQDYYERRTKEGKPDARSSDASSTMPSARCSTWSGPRSHDPRHRGTL
ncbi:transposase [Streptomyces sp. Isolate_219]|uniref:transposase n=1 Tax=Streptomyces sp. Isolate_219 TaxID=2950110 RepID=UPI003967A487